VTLQLVKSECLLVYTVRIRVLLKTDFVVMQFLVKLFRTANKDITNKC